MPFDWLAVAIEALVDVPLRPPFGFMFPGMTPLPLSLGVEGNAWAVDPLPSMTGHPDSATATPPKTAPAASAAAPASRTRARLRPDGATEGGGAKGGANCGANSG